MRKGERKVSTQNVEDPFPGKKSGSGNFLEESIRRKLSGGNFPAESNEIVGQKKTRPKTNAA
jgi:hypothetical protein